MTGRDTETDRDHARYYADLERAAQHDAEAHWRDDHVPPAWNELPDNDDRTQR